MKRFLSFILCCAMLAAFTACTGTKEKIDIPTTSPQKGVVSGNTYTNEYLDLKFTIPDNTWTFATNEELASACEIDPSAFSEQSLSTLIENNTTVYDAIIQTDSEQISVLVGIENPALSSLGKGTTAADFIDSTLESFVSAIDSETYPCELSDSEKTTIGGHEYIRRTLSVTAGEEKAVQTYYARSVGDYLCVILTTHMGNTTVEQVEAMFS